MVFSPSMTAPHTPKHSRVPRHRGRVRLVVAIVSALAPAVGFAQETVSPGRADALRVYLDCSGRRGCSADTYRQEITFVNWVREPQDAQVHLMITSENSGGGGTRYTIELIGRETLDGMVDQFMHASSVTDVQEETVSGLVRLSTLGLVRFAAAAGFGDGIRVVGRPTGESDVEGKATSGPQETDPWDYWVFGINGSFDVEAEDLQESKRLDFGVSANRTTDIWKLNARGSGDFQRESFELPSEGRTVRDDSNRWNASAYAVRSLGEHWGVGTEVGADNSTRLNRELQVGWGSGVEYNYFPYAESNRRSLLARYVISLESAQYQDTTVFDLLAETLLRHEVSFSYDAREPWGNANVGIGASQYLDRPAAWSLRLDGFIRYRLFRGFSVNFSGGYETLRDQIYLPRRVLSDEDILLGRRQLPTEARAEFRIGFSYSFGSIFNNAVNQRFRFGVR